jgi:hypothetical protein
MPSETHKLKVRALRLLLRLEAEKRYSAELLKHAAMLASDDEDELPYLLQNQAWPFDLSCS